MNFAIVSEIFVNADSSSVSSLVYTDIAAGLSAFYNKAQYVPIFTDPGYKAVTIIDKTGNNIVPPVTKQND